MGKIIPISTELAREKAWRRPVDYLSTLTSAIVPITVADLVQASTTLPIGFAPLGDQYQLVALLSPLPGRNFFVGSSGQWLGRFVPARFRARPFSLLVRGSEAEPVLAIDEDALCARDAIDVEPFLNEEGEPTTLIRAALRILETIRTSGILTARATAALKDAGVLEDWPVELALEGKTITTGGLSRVSEDALQSLEDEAFLQLRATGALPLAYLHLASMQHLGVFAELDALNKRLAPAPSTAASPQPPAALDIDEFFRMHGNLSLNFD